MPRSLAGRGRRGRSRTCRIRRSLMGSPSRSSGLPSATRSDSMRGMLGALIETKHLLMVASVRLAAHRLAVAPAVISIICEKMLFQKTGWQWKRSAVESAAGRSRLFGGV
eukprot:9274057-Pyramimonas_sp.AAC.1